jgi:hypothetical protein
MTLLNGLLALGALAFTVPLAIHLLFRSRFTTVDWGAMHLLDSVIRINRRRLQLMNLLLLLLRCLIPILLAFCLARPVLTGFQSLPGDAPQSLVIAIDDSQSMSARDETGMTRMERVKRDLSQLVGKLSRRDEVIMILSGRVDAPASSMGPQDALRQLRQLAPLSGPIQLDRFLRAAVNAAGDASHPQRRVLLVSDFQSENVGDGSIEGLSRVADSLATADDRPVVSFLNYGAQSDQLANVSVDSVTVESPAVVAGRGGLYSARIRNASDRSAQDLRLLWSIDGQPLPPRTITISPRSTATNRLTHRIDDPGVHQVTLAVEHADALAEDNRRSIGVDVTSEIKVVLVDGQPSNRPLEGEADFLAIALSPFAFGGEDLPDAVRTTVVTQRQLAKQFSQQQPDILVLANVNNLGDESASLVAQFVLGGGALVAFDGDLLDVDAYNQGWACDQGTLAFPARLGDFVGSDDPQTAKPMAIGDLNAQYTPWGLLESKDERPLAKVEVYGYRKLILDPSVTSRNADGRSDDDELTLPPTITLLSMANGDPLVVSARRGRGKVVQFAVPCDAGWSTLPLRMVYLPMVQQLMLDLAGTRKQTTVSVGEAIAVPIAELDLPSSDAQQVSAKPDYTVTPPQGAEVSIEPTDEASPQLLFGDTDRSGTYRFRRSLPQPEGTPQSDGEPLIASTVRVVQVPFEESRLRDVDPARLSLVADSVGGSVYSDLSSLENDDLTRRFGREIWRLLLVALLIGMIAELFLQQRLIRRSLRGEPS